MGSKSEHTVMSMDYISTGRAFNRLMEETFHEKQIEVIVTLYVENMCIAH